MSFGRPKNLGRPPPRESPSRQVAQPRISRGHGYAVTHSGPAPTVSTSSRLGDIFLERQREVAVSAQIKEEARAAAEAVTWGLREDIIVDVQRRRRAETGRGYADVRTLAAAVLERSPLPRESQAVLNEMVQRGTASWQTSAPSSVQQERPPPVSDFGENPRPPVSEAGDFGRPLVLPGKKKRDQLFRDADTEGTGRLSHSAAGKAIERLWGGLAGNVVERAIRTADSGKRGLIRRKEWRLLLQSALFFNQNAQKLMAIGRSSPTSLTRSEFGAACPVVGVSLGRAEGSRAFASMGGQQSGAVILAACSVRTQSPFYGVACVFCQDRSTSRSFVRGALAGWQRLPIRFFNARALGRRR